MTQPTRISSAMLLLILVVCACTTPAPPILHTTMPATPANPTAPLTAEPTIDPFKLISNETIFSYVEGLATIQPYSGWRNSASEGEAEALDYVADTLNEFRFLQSSGLELESQGFPVFLATEIWESRLFLTKEEREIEVPADALRGHRYDVTQALRFDSDGVLNDSARDPVQRAGEPLMVRSAADLENLDKSDLRGKVLFLHSELIEDFEAARKFVDELIAKGIAALVLVTTSDHSKYLGEGKALEELMEEDTLPMLYVRIEDLVPVGITSWSDFSTIEAARLIWDTDVFSPGTSSNLVARIAGMDSSRAVILGAHIDSANSPGAIDNGINCAALLEVAHVLNEAQIRPPIDIYLVWFGSEEIGLYGSQHFVNSHGEVLDRALGAFIMDGIIVSTPTSLILLDGWSYGNFGNDEIPFARYLADEAASRDIHIDEVQDFQGLASDNGVFNGFVSTSGFAFGSTAGDVAHSPYDSADAVQNQGELMEDVASMALIAALQTGYDLPDLRITPEPERRALILASHTEAIHMTAPSLVALDQALAWEGFDVDVIPYGQALTPADLLETDLVVALPVIDLTGPDGDVTLQHDGWRDGEVEALVAYVQDGGFLVLTNSANRIMLRRVFDPNEDWEDVNKLGTHFGVTFQEGQIPGTSITVVGDHPLTASQSSLKMLENNAVPFTMESGEILAEGSDGLGAGLIDYGDSGGQVLALADAGILGFAGIGNPGYDNFIFLRNLAHFAHNR